MDYEFKFKNNNVKKELKKVGKIEEEIKIEIVEDENVKTVYYSKKPSFVWTDKKSNYNKSFEEKLSDYIKEGKERSDGVKTEFLTNREETILAIRKTKDRKVKEKRNNR